MLSMQCTVQSVKCNLRCSVDVHSSKITRTQNILNIPIVVFSQMVLNFAESFFLRVLNVANFLKSRNLILEKVSKNKGWFLGRGTLFTRNMCFLVKVRHITRDVCFVGREHISVGICVSWVRERITGDMCFPGWGTHQ